MERERSQGPPSSPVQQLGNLAGKIRAQIHVLCGGSDEVSSPFQEWGCISTGAGALSYSLCNTIFHFYVTH